MVEGVKGKYSFVDRFPLKQGKNSLIYLGRDEQEREVCIKVYNDQPENVGGFEKEIEFQMTLSHPNILPIFDFGHTEEENKPALVMPFASEGDLRDYLKAKSFVPFSEARAIFEQIAAAIDYIHSKGIIHRDIKPENILFFKNHSTVCLSDFGIARYFPMLEDTQSATLGTTTYLSPEQIEDQTVTSLTDIYSFSLVIYEVLTGSLPFDVKQSLYHQLNTKIAGTLIEPKKKNHIIDETVNDAIMLGLSTAPEARPASANQMVQLLSGNRTLPKKKSDRAGIMGWWSALDSSDKTKIVTAIIAGIVTILVALIKIFPEIFK